MSRFSPTVTAQPGPDWAGAIADAFKTYVQLKDRKADRQERSQDRAEVRADREEVRKDREAARDRQRARDVLAGIVPGQVPTASTSGLAGVEPPAPAPDPATTPPIGGARQPAGPSLEDVAPATAPVAPAPEPPKPAAPGSFNPAAGGFAPVTRVQLTPDFYYDPTIPNQMAAQKRQSALDEYLAKEQIRHQVNPPAWAPHSREEYDAVHGKPAYHPSSLDETVRLHNLEAEGTAAAQERHRAKKGGSGADGDSGDGSGDGTGDYTTTDARRDKAANDFAARYVDSFYGNADAAVKYIEANPDLKKQAARLGLTDAHYNAAAARRSAPGKRPYPQEGDGSDTELPTAGAGSSAAPISGPILSQSTRTTRALAGRTAQPTSPAMALATGAVQPKPKAAAPQVDPQMAVEFNAASEKYQKLLAAKVPAEEAKAAYDATIKLIGKKYGQVK